MRVAILGCGPSGLLAAHAADLRGTGVQIFSDKKPSVISGAQWLQHPIPNLTEHTPPAMVTYAKVGEEQGYARKAYNEPEAEVSWQHFASGDYPAWPLKGLYDQLWDRWESGIEPGIITPFDLEGFCSDFDLVFCSLPAKTLCDNPDHNFIEQRIVITEQDFVKVNNLIVYNGREEDEWYRASCLFGYSSTEYAIHHKRLPSSDVLGHQHYYGIKPVTTDCNCHSDLTNLVRIGRFGRWLRGVLVHHAFDQVYERTSNNG